MKSVKFSALVAVAVIAASCAKEGTHSVDESDKVALEPMCIEASDESQTKTVLVGKSVNWTDGDQIAVYSNYDGYKNGYKFSAAKINGNSATFNGEVPAGTESFFAVYPPERVSSASASGAVVTIPSDQTPAEGTFGEELNITIAKGTKTPGTPNVGTIRFRNVCSYVKFTVPAYVSDVESVKISSDNAIAGKLTVDYTGENPSSTIAADGEKSISMSGSFGAGKTFIFVIAPGTVSNFRIDITAANGNWTRTVSKGFTVEAGETANLGTIDFKVTAEASHVYDGETLVGTNLSVKLGPDGYLNKYASDLKFDIFNKDGYKVRSYSSETGTVASSTVSFNWRDYADEWPYLPQGKYTIKGSYTRPDGGTQAISGTFTVPKPTFKVNAPLATTNYDTYKDPTLEDAAAAANAQDGSTIFGVKDNGVCISKDILTNPKYASLIEGYSFTIDGKPVKAGDNANQTWAAHDVVAKYKFDNVEETSSPLTCYVTGLPFVDSSIVPGNYSSWASSKATISEGSIQLKGASSASNCGYICTPKIVSPGSINVIVTVKAKSSAKYSTSPSNLYIGSTNNNTSPNGSESVSINNQSAEKSITFFVNNAYISFRAAGIKNLTQTISSLSIKYN